MLIVAHTPKVLPELRPPTWTTPSPPAGLQEAYLHPPRLRACYKLGKDSGLGSIPEPKSSIGQVLGSFAFLLHNLGVPFICYYSSCSKVGGWDYKRTGLTRDIHKANRLAFKFCEAYRRGPYCTGHVGVSGAASPGQAGETKGRVQ